MAGLLAARVLSEFYARVIVMERDPLPEAADHRRGVPQSRHVHAVLPRGAWLLEELFGGLTAAGPCRSDYRKRAHNVWLMSSGHRLAPVDSSLRGLRATQGPDISPHQPPPLPARSRSCAGTHTL
jgi:hypothetical protein